MKGDIQYISDSLLIEKLFLIDQGINKTAGLADGLLSSLSSSIMEWGKEHIDTTSAESIITSLSNLLIPGVLFKIHPALGVLATTAEVLGFSPTSVIKDIVVFVVKTLRSGGELTLDSINDIGKNAVSKQAGTVTAGNNMLSVLHQIEKQGQLVRFVRTAGPFSEVQSLLGLGRPKDTPEIPFFGSSKGGLIEKVFGQLFKMKAHGKARWLLGGFVVWIIKTILLGAGLVAGGEKIMSLFLPKKPAESQNDTEIILTQNQNQENEKTPGQSFVPQSSSKLIPTGTGQDLHVNDHKTSKWVVPMVGGSIEETLLAWTHDVYHGLEGKESVIVSSPEFHQVVSEIKTSNNSNSNKLTIPPQFKSRKQIVDKFIKAIED